MSTSSLNRRRFIKVAVIGAATIPFAGMLASQSAFASDLPKLEEDNAQAVALGYVHDTNAVDQGRYPQHTAEQNCANCNLIQGADGEEWRPCAIFPGKAVAADGWCAAWVRKPA